MKKLGFLNNKKGVTLIALVVTMIIILILAGITTAAIVGRNGLKPLENLYS